MPTISLDGEVLFYQERGTRGAGPTLLFVHGAGGTWRHWGLQVRDLEGAYRLAPDLPGHGRSAGPGRQTVEAYTEVMMALIRTLDLTEVTVIGHSMGGAIALTMARQAPETVARLGLVGTGARLRVRSDFLAGLLAADPAPVIRQIALASYHPGAPEAQIAQTARELAATDPRVYHGDFSACDAFDLMDRLEAIAQPALVLTGTEDRMTPPKYAHYLAERLPNATLRLVPDAGHMVMLEQPAAVAEALRQFLSLH
ncbi:MAG: alpha/beta hydrolase [Ardenticatenaceae bacterium]|nr:alpha/beta hydrolase [Ardenticatenaceae bacterium]